jgi:hypothetical protein
MRRITSSTVAGLLMLSLACLSGCSPSEKTPPAKTEGPKTPAATQEPVQSKATGTGRQTDASVFSSESPRTASKIELPAGAPKVSQFAPAADLEDQFDYYLKDLQDTVASVQDFKDAPEGLIARESNTLIALALALGLHDQENKYQSSAAAVMKAAAELAGAKDYASSKKGVDALLAAAGGKGGGGLKWEKVAALDQLMKQVPLVHTKLKTKTEDSRFKSKAVDTAGYSAVLAAIAQTSIADAGEAKTPEDVKKWEALCVDMRDTAGAVNAAIRRQDQGAAEAAMTKLQQNCDDCHKAFHPEALGKTGN